ncbi:hypothetical protein ACJ41O_009946 [Fusarium nematophilum]
MPPQRRRRPVEDEDPEEDARPRQRVNNNDSDDEQDEDMDAENHLVPTVDDQMAKKLVRYALSCEFNRTPIRRDGIKERVLGNQGRSFRRIFTLAQKQLREVWGMELRELPVREKLSLQERRQAMRNNSQLRTGSGAYILTSTLPEAYRSAAILKATKELPFESFYQGFYTTVIAIIWLNQGEISDQKLKRNLARLNADQNISTDKTEIILKGMERHGYVDKRIDRPPIGQDGEPTITWHVGPRGKEEVGLDGVMGMVREVYGESWDQGMEKKLRSSLNLKDLPAENDEGEDGDQAEGRDGPSTEYRLS